MRRLLIPGLALGFATMACAAATRPGEVDPEERFPGAERVGEAELERLLPGMRAVYIAGPGRLRYRGIVSEQYQTRPGRHAISLRSRGNFNSLRVWYPEALALGSYRIRDGELCTILAGEREERCRGVFRLENGGYALSTYENPSRAEVRIQLEPIR